MRTSSVTEGRNSEPMSPVRVLITGGSGFVGQWLCRRLLQNGHMVTVGGPDQGAGPGVLDAAQRRAIQWVPLDVVSEDSVGRALDQAAPDWVVHLAAIAFPQDATAAPVKAFDVNALGAFRLLTALDARGARGTRVLMVGSAEQYGMHAPDEMPLPETATQAPLSVYGAVKATQEVIALQLARSSGGQVVCTRSFNHSGAGQGRQYLLPSLVARAAALPRTGGTLAMGNGTPVRDYLHVADVAAAYEALLTSGQPGEVYNVSSGQGTTVHQIATRVITRAGKEAAMTSDAALTRKVDVPFLVGDNTKLRRATGWAPERSIDDIIDDLMHATTR